jgi:DNA-binding Lrp family transcriptional regulator
VTVAEEPITPARAAKELDRFTRRELADRIGVTPIAVGRYIAKMEEDGLIVRDGRHYDWHPHDPDGKPVEPGDPRVLARKLGNFTVDRFAAAGNLTRQQARDRIKRMLEGGIVRRTGDKEWRDRGMNADIFEVIELPKGKTPRPSYAARERERLDKEAKRLERQPVAGVKRSTDLPRDPTMRLLATRVLDAGGKVRRAKAGSHFVATLPNKTTVGLSDSADEAAWKKVAAKMRRQGFDPGV